MSGLFGCPLPKILPLYNDFSEFLLGLGSGTLLRTLRYGRRPRDADYALRLRR